MAPDPKEQGGVPEPPDVLRGLPGAPRWWRRLVRVRGMRPLLGLWLLLSVVVVATILLTPARLAPIIPGDDSLGRVASATIKANRDYEVLDTATTELRRDEAGRSVLPVYDYDAEAIPLLQKRLEAAFAEGRNAVEEWQRQFPGKAARVSAAQVERMRGVATGKQKAHAVPEEAELLRFLGTRKDAFLKALQAVIDDDEYQELARSGFDQTVEHAAVRLADPGVHEEFWIVAERELLNAERERGITVHRVTGGSQLASGPEKLVRDIDRIRDLAQARTEVERRASAQLADLPAPLRRVVTQMVRRALRPNLAYDDEETRRRIQEKRDSVRDVVIQIRRGEKILGDGEVITQHHLLLLRALREAGSGSGAEQVRWGSALFAALICAAAFEFGRRNVRKFRLRSRDVLLLACALVLQLLLVRAGLSGADRLSDLLVELPPLRGVSHQLITQLLVASVPLAAGSMLVRFLVFSEAALIWTIAYAPLCGLLSASGLQPAVVALVAGVVAADRVGHAGSRTAVFRAGAFTAAIQMLLLAAFALFQARFWQPETAAQLSGALLGGALFTPALVLLVAPLCEAVFGVVTDLRLLHLASFNHPVLKDLIVQAPGTYHHSIVLGQLVEAAAREIGANPLLARVGAYYHDIGKGKNPLYFGENQRNDNRHDQLSSAVSAELIRRHVQDGIELAVQAHLPAAVIDFIPQHHGTRLIGYFFHKAREEAERTGQPPPDEQLFRYPGPKPQTREAALVMIGESVVATSRKLAELPGPQLEQELGQLVDHAVISVEQDRQLDECDLTTRDLARTKEAFVRTLVALIRAQADGAGPLRPPALRVLGGQGAAADEAAAARRAGTS